MEKITGLNISSTSSVENENVLQPVTEVFLQEFEKILSSGKELFVFNGVLCDEEGKKKELQRINIELGKIERSF